MKKIKAILVMTLMVQGIVGFGQEDSTKTKASKSFQISLTYPISTEGVSGKDSLYNISLNALIGVSKGIKGVEASGFGNITNGNVRGTQLAGFGNSVKGSFKGMQAGGFFNINGKDFTGAQLGGFMNLNLGDFRGGQFSGFLNYNKGDFKGFQSSGFINKAQNVNGLQFAGFLNVADTVGSQYSFFMNKAKHVKGTQFGFINIADTIEGSSIGFINIIKNGYKKIEIETGEIFYLTVNGKMGSEKFYNVLTVGVKPIPDEFSYTFGYGFGFRTFQKGKTSMNVDVTFAQVNEGEVWTGRMNMINQIKIKFAHQLKDGIEIYGGPSLIYTMQDIVDDLGNPFGEEIKTIPLLNVFQKRDNFYQHTAALGFNLGVRF